MERDLRGAASAPPHVAATRSLGDIGGRSAWWSHAKEGPNLRHQFVTVCIDSPHQYPKFTLIASCSAVRQGRGAGSPAAVQAVRSSTE